MWGIDLVYRGTVYRATELYTIYSAKCVQLDVVHLQQQKNSYYTTLTSPLIDLRSITYSHRACKDFKVFFTNRKEPCLTVLRLQSDGRIKVFFICTKK